MVPEMTSGQRRPSFLEDGLDGEDRRLGVEGVEDGLDDQQVAAAVEQPQRGGAVRRHEGVEVDVAGARVVDVRGDRGGAGGRAQGAGDVARALVGGDHVGGAAGQARRLEVELVGQRLEAVVGQRDGVGVEGVGLDQVGAGLEVLAVDRLDDRGLGQGEQVVVADQVAGPVGEPLAAVAGLVGPVALDRGAHGAVDDQDPLGQGRAQLVARVAAPLPRADALHGGLGAGLAHAALLSWGAGGAPSGSRQPRRVSEGWTGCSDGDTGARGG